MNRKIFIIISLLALLIHCEKDMSPIQRLPLQNPPKQPSFADWIQGRVILENQTEHSNCLVYIDSLDRGTGTDSSGFYSFQFAEHDTVYSGIFTVYYFLYDYDLDSAQIKLVNGKVQLDTCDVDSAGSLKLKQMKQILLIDGWTNRQEYQIGDTLIFTARFKNLTDRTLHLFIYSAFNDLGYVILYRNFHYPQYIISPLDPVARDLDIFLYPAGVRTATVGYVIPSGAWLPDTLYPLLPAEYIVIAFFEIKDRDAPIFVKVDNFIFNNWPNIHIGKEPEIDRFPNKYKYPKVSIID